MSEISTEMGLMDNFHLPAWISHGKNTRMRQYRWENWKDNLQANRRCNNNANNYNKNKYLNTYIRRHDN
jgi:hypothetical protein